jgi:hypothetical protein
VTPSRPDSPDTHCQSSTTRDEKLCTMDVSGVDCVANKWLRSARMDFYIAPPNGFENGSRIEGGLVERSVTVDGGDSQELDARIVGAEEESVCILME